MLTFKQTKFNREFLSENELRKIIVSIRPTTGIKPLLKFRK